MTEDMKPKLGDEAPTWKDCLWVLLVVGLVIALSWITWFEFGWFH